MNITFSSNEYKVAIVDAINAQLPQFQEIISNLLLLSYNEGKRAEDDIVRSLLSEMLQPISDFKGLIEKHHDALEGSSNHCMKIINYCLQFFSNNSSMMRRIDALKEELYKQQFYDVEDKTHEENRLVNLFAMNMIQNLKDWIYSYEKTFLPLLSEISNNYNFLLLCIQLIDLSVVNKDRQIIEISQYIKDFFSYYLIISNEKKDEKDLFRILIDSVYSMGLSDIYISKNIITNAVLETIIKQCIIDNEKFKRKIHNDSKEIDDVEIIESDEHIEVLNEIIVRYKKILNIEDVSESDFSKLPCDLNKDGKNRFVFNKPERYDASLRNLLHKWNGNLIFYLKWLIKELKSNPKLEQKMNSFNQIIYDLDSYIVLVKKIFITASIESNQKIGGLLQDTKYYISTDQKHELIEIVERLHVKIIEFMTIIILEIIEEPDYKKSIGRFKYIKGELDTIWVSLVREFKEM